LTEALNAEGGFSRGKDGTQPETLLPERGKRKTIKIEGNVSERNFILGVWRASRICKVLKSSAEGEKKDYMKGLDPRGTGNKLSIWRDEGKAGRLSEKPFKNNHHVEQNEWKESKTGHCGIEKFLQ